MPSDKSYGGDCLTEKDVVLRGGSGPQNYGHPRNCFWNIVGSALGFRRDAEESYALQRGAFTAAGYVTWRSRMPCNAMPSLLPGMAAFGATLRGHELGVCCSIVALLCCHGTDPN